MSKTQIRTSEVLVIAIALAALTACTIQTDKDKNKKNVKISTMFGNVDVNANDQKPPDTGLAVYPGAKVKPNHHDEEGKGKSGNANVNISSPFGGVKVAAATYTTDDGQSKVADFYKNDLKKYGQVIECRGEISERKDSDDLYCRDRSRGDNELQLGVGSKLRRRIVAIKPGSGNGTEFSLVYVEIHGKEGGV